METTAVCNLKCTFCYPHYTGDLANRKKRFMDFSLFKKIIDEIRHFATSVSLHGSGEPLLHPEIFDMIKYAKSKGLDVSFSTNALLLTEEKIEKILDSGLDSMILSVDGVNFETYNLHRRPSTENAYNNMLSNIKLLCNRKKNKRVLI